MSGSTFGRTFTVTTWGESHGPFIGAVVDGCPAGLPLSIEQDIMPYMKRRRPGQNQFCTNRMESDQVQILSGLYQGFTTGTPISLLIPNNDAKSNDYESLHSLYRPGHADYSYDAKYGYRDPNGGGRSSGRETAARVAAGSIARKILKELGVSIFGFTRGIGPYLSDKKNISQEEILNNPLFMPDDNIFTKASAYLNECQLSGDSTGSIVECQIHGLTAGLGEPVFHKMEAVLSQAILSIGGVRAFEVGDGIQSSTMKGSTFNDSPVGIKSNSILKETNHSGGIVGGISDGSPITFRAFFKPTPSIALPQKTISKNGEPCQIQIAGRHDPVIAPRAVAVIEAMTAIVLVDFLFDQTHAQMKHLVDFYASSISKN